MKLNIFAVCTLSFVCMLSTISEAKTLMGASGWTVKKVNADSPYCIMARNYESDILFSVAKNIDAEGTLALNFQRDIFDLTKSYKIQFSVNGVVREYFLRPASTGLIIARVGQDPTLLMAMQNAQTLSVNIDSQSFEMNLSGYGDGFNSLSQCLGNGPVVKTDEPVMEAKAIEEKRIELPRPPVAEPIVQNDKIDTLLQENQRLTQLLVEQNAREIPSSASSASDKKTASLEIELSQSKQKNAELLSEIAKLEADLLQSRQSLNPDISGIIAEKESQIASLKHQNESLKNSLENVKNLSERIAVLENQNSSLKAERDALKLQKTSDVPSQVVIKEVIREVPILSGDISASEAEIAVQIAELETESKIFQVERDEYRRLLQEERRRIKSSPNLQGGEQNNLIADMQKLQSEKEELARELDYQKSLALKNSEIVQPAEQQVIVKEVPVVDNAKLSELQMKIAELQDQIANTEGEKAKLLQRMQVIDAEAANTQKQLAEMTVNKLADDSEENIRKEAEEKTIRAEMAALKAQNDILRQQEMDARNEAIEVARNRKKIEEKQQQSQSVVKSVAQPAPVVLSGDEIRMIVNESGIPLKSSIDRIDRLSGPDYAAFRWDTGTVYGSGELSRMSDKSAFTRSVDSYIAKTESRCVDSFDKNIQNVQLSNGQKVVTADIACVDENANGAAASVVFFEQNGMFYALAHEADMDKFQMAMDMREKMLTGIAEAF